MTYHSSMGSLGQARPSQAGARSRPTMSFLAKPPQASTGGRSVHGLGQLTMDPQTVALLKGCSDNCTKQFGADLFSLSMCFANCNVQYPPTVALPGIPPITPPAIPPYDPGGVPPIVPGVIFPPATPPPVTPVTPVTPTATAGSDMKMWVIGGAVAVAAVGAFLYFKKK